ncbi:MAG: MTH938/NDUFAF3 family protein [Thermoplasmata archaeon]
MLKIEGTEFGEVTVNGEKYDHDIVAFPNEVIERKKWITKDKHGTSHRFTRDEMEEYIEGAGHEAIDEVIVGTGQYGKLGLLPETREYLEQKDISYKEKKTPELVGRDIDESETMTIIHVTC